MLEKILEFLTKHYNDDINSLTVDNWNKIFQKNSISDYLRYTSFNDKNNLFYNNDGTYGFGVEIEPIIRTGLDSISVMSEIISKLPDNVYLQVFYFGSKDIEDDIEKFRYEHSIKEKVADEDEAQLLRGAVNEFCNFLHSKTKEPLTKTMKTKIRRIKIIFSAVTTKEGKMKDLLVFQKNMYDVFATNNFHPKHLTPPTLIKCVYEILNPDKDFSEFLDYDKNYFINKQCVSPNSRFFVDDNFVKVGKSKYWINSTPVTFSDDFHLTEFNQKIGDFLSSSLNTNQFNDNFVIAISITKASQMKKSKIEQSHSVIATQNWGEKFRKFVNVRKESLDILDKIVEKQEPIFEINMDISIAGDSYEEALENTQAITSFWKKTLTEELTKIGIDKTFAIHHLAFLSNLPMMMNDEYFQQVGGKYRTFFLNQVSSLIPLEAGNTIRGYNLPLVTRRGYLSFIDLFNSNTNFNGYIVATSGAGKSVFLNMIGFMSYTRGDKIFVLDYDNSFGGLCEAVNGQYLNLDPSKLVISFNPFTDIKSLEQLKEESSYLADFIYLLGANKNVSEAEKDEKLIKGELQEIMLRIYNDPNYSEELEITTIRDYILDNYQSEERFINFARQLTQYCKEGIYGGWFNGECNFDITKDLLAVEFKGVENHPDLRDPLIMIIMYHFGKIMYEDNPNKPRIQLILDEAHRFLEKNPRMDDFIEQAYRRARKFGASMVIATQGFGDIYSLDKGLSKVGRVIVENSSWKFFLKQQPVSVSALLKSKLFDLSSKEEIMLKNTHTTAMEYSELFIMNPYEEKNAFRLIMPKFFYWLSTTKREDKQLMQSLMQKHNKSKIEIIIGGYLDVL